MKRISLSTLSWNDHHALLFAEFQNDVQTSVNLAHRDQPQEICIFTDASHELWAAMVTQCHKHMLERHITDRIHQPLSFLAGRFCGSKESWTPLQREAFAIYEVFNKLEYLLIVEHNARVFTDHFYLCFILEQWTLTWAVMSFGKSNDVAYIYHDSPT